MQRLVHVCGKYRIAQPIFCCINWTLIAHAIVIPFISELPQIYTANHATCPIKIRNITVQIYGNFWVTQQDKLLQFVDNSMEILKLFEVFFNPCKITGWDFNFIMNKCKRYIMSKMSCPVLYLWNVNDFTEKLYL